MCTLYVCWQWSCCGVHGPSDFMYSHWYNMTQESPEHDIIVVPASCCPPDNGTTLLRRHCQQTAARLQQGSAYEVAMNHHFNTTHHNDTLQVVILFYFTISHLCIFFSVQFTVVGETGAQWNTFGLSVVLRPSRRKYSPIIILNVFGQPLSLCSLLLFNHIVEGFFRNLENMELPKTVPLCPIPGYSGISVGGRVKHKF